MSRIKYTCMKHTLMTQFNNGFTQSNNPLTSSNSKLYKLKNEIGITLKIHTQPISKRAEIQA